MQHIADITENENWITATTLQERYGKKKDYQVVDADIRVSTSDTELTECPAIYREDGDCHFIVAKAGDNTYRPQYFYRTHEMFGKGAPEYDDLATCLVTLLHTQSDHETSKITNNES